MHGRDERWSRAIRTVVGVAATLAAVDLGQVALTNPANLTPGTVAALAGLYLAGVAAAAVPCALGIALWRAPRPVSALRALLLAAGAFVLAQEAVLRQLSPLSAGRPWVVLGL